MLGKYKPGVFSGCGGHRATPQPVPRARNERRGSGEGARKWRAGRASGGCPRVVGWGRWRRLGAVASAGGCCVVGGWRRGVRPSPRCCPLRFCLAAALARRRVWCRAVPAVPPVPPCSPLPLFPPAATVPVPPPLGARRLRCRRRRIGK